MSKRIKKRTWDFKCGVRNNGWAIGASTGYRRAELLGYWWINIDLFKLDICISIYNYYNVDNRVLTNSYY